MNKYNVVYRLEIAGSDTQLEVQPGLRNYNSLTKAYEEVAGVVLSAVIDGEEVWLVGLIEDDLNALIDMLVDAASPSELPTPKR